LKILHTDKPKTKQKDKYDNKDEGWWPMRDGLPEGHRRSLSADIQGQHWETRKSRSPGINQRPTRLGVLSALVI